jgi:hypothetical protein
VVELTPPDVVVDVSPTEVVELPPTDPVEVSTETVVVLSTEPVEVPALAVVVPPTEPIEVSTEVVGEVPPTIGSCAEATGASAARIASARSVARVATHGLERRKLPIRPTLSPSLGINLRGPYPRRPGTRALKLVPYSLLPQFPSFFVEQGLRKLSGWCSAAPRAARRNRRRSPVTGDLRARETGPPEP